MVLFRTIIFSEPSDSNAAITALLAPPAPNTTDVPFFGFQLGYLHFMLFRKPKASVLSAYIFFFLCKY
jgi:hypothetical protein